MVSARQAISSTIASSRRTKGEGIVSVALHPGALKSDLNRHTPVWLLFLAGWILKEPIYGEYTEIFAE